MPAAAPARLLPFSAVLADIGDEQSLAANLSTFSGHLRRIQARSPTSLKEQLLRIAPQHAACQAVRGNCRAAEKVAPGFRRCGGRRTGARWCCWTRWERALTRRRAPRSASRCCRRSRPAAPAAAPSPSPPPTTGASGQHSFRCTTVWDAPRLAWASGTRAASRVRRNSCSGGSRAVHRTTHVIRCAEPSWQVCESFFLLAPKFSSHQT